MKILLGMLALASLSGCTSGTWWQAKVLSGEDTEQAIALEMSQDPKTCTRARGSGSYLGIEGFVDHIVARGKNVSFQDCLNAQNPAISTTRLPPSPAKQEAP